MSSSEATKPQRGHPSPMMFVSIGIGTVVAILLIGVVTYFTGGHVSKNTGLPQTALVGQKVGSFSLDSLYGGKVTSPYSAGQPTVLIFFASYCTPCQGEMPKVATYLNTHSTGYVQVVGIDASDALGPARSFIKKDHVTFPVAFDPNNNVTTGIFQFGQIPETVFVSAKGVVKSVYFGAIPKETLAAGIASLNKG